MKGEIKDWWGFRLRVPTDFDHKPPTRVELTIFFLVVGLAFQLSWLIVLLYAPLQHKFFLNSNDLLQTIWEPLKLTIIVPISIFLFFIVIARMLPIKWIQSTWIGAIIVLSRESGNLKTWDMSVLAIGAIGLSLSVFKFELNLMITQFVILLQLVIISFGLAMFQERVSYADRRWQIDVPEWLREKKDGDGSIIWEQGKMDTFQRGVIQPEENAHPVFQFGYGGKFFPIGISISEGIIIHLRNLNRQYSRLDRNEKDKTFCFLYLEKPTEMVLMDKSPVDIPDAKKKIEVLCQQIISIAQELRITRFQLATAVLNWVQGNFEYQIDDESTQDFPGGPYSEYGRFALETIHDKVGDCECTTLLCVTLLSHLGFDAGILHVKINDPATGEHSFHAAVGLEGKGLFLPDEFYYSGLKYIEHETAKGKKYLYGETATDRERSFGEIPECWQEFITVQKIDHIDASKRLKQEGFTS